MKIIIESMPEVQDFSNPKKIVTYYEVAYVIDGGHRGMVRVLKEGATAESIQAAVRKDAATAMQLIGADVSEG